MKYKFFIISIFISTFVFSQEKLDVTQVYFENNLAFKNSDNNLFSGVLENYRRKHLSYSAEYQKGIILKESFYFNYQKNLGIDIPYKEIYYSSGIINKEITFNSKNERTSTTVFDENRKKKYFEQYKNGETILTQNFENGKLHGKATCYDKNGNYQENYFKDGKLLK